MARQSNPYAKGERLVDARLLFSMIGLFPAGAGGGEYLA